MEAFAAAIERGADVLEVDVRNAPTASSSRTTTAAMRRVRHCSPTCWHSPPHGVGFNLDLKASGIESPLIELVRAAGLTGRVTCTGGNWAMLAAIHRAPRDARHAPPKGTAAPPAAAPVVRLARAAAAGRVRRAARLLQPPARQPAARAPPAPHGGEIWVWTVDRPRRSSACCASRSTASARTTPPATAGPERTTTPVRVCTGVVAYC